MLDSSGREARTLTSTSADSVDTGLERIRDAVRTQLGVARPQAADVDPASVVRFGRDLPETLTPERRAELIAEAAELDPWLQGPFALGGDLVVGGTWRCDQRWIGLGAEVPESLAGKRVLDVGSNAGYDPFMFAHRGAERVVGCEPFGFHQQAVFLESIYHSGVQFEQIGWEQLSPERFGTFDLIHCNGLLYHEPNPMALLLRLRSMLAPGGELILGSMTLADAEQSEYLRFVPGSYFGDPTWWFVPGRLALRWMLEVTGFRIAYTFGEWTGPPGAFPVLNAYFRATGVDPVAHLQSQPAP
jgi:SAM-dependent methyltransferase